MPGNGIQRGVVAGDRIKRVIDANTQALRVSDQAIRRRPLAKVSPRMVGRLDIVNMARFLFTANSRNISGQALSVCSTVEAIA